MRLSPDFNLNYAEEIGSLLTNMMEEGIITRFEGGPETVYGIAEGQAPIASFYRNTIVHFFLTRAVAELALLAVSEQRESSESLSQFWSPWSGAPTVLLNKPTNSGAGAGSLEYWTLAKEVHQRVQEIRREFGVTEASRLHMERNLR